MSGSYESFALRNAASFFEKFERYDCQELLAFASSHWMLSTEDFKVPTEPPMGLITQMGPVNGFMTMTLFPEEDGIEPLDLREVHQIIRELTRGIYVLNQLPYISLEAVFDQSTACQIPPAYLDTRVGQLLINVDYMMKALWHGSYFPKEKRIKFSERWRGNLDVNASGKPETRKPLLTEFTSAGMLDITKDPDYAGVYDGIPVAQPGDAEMAEERRFFMNHVDDLCMQMSLFHKAVHQYKNLFVVEPSWLISSMVRLTEDKISPTDYERLNAKLQLHEIMLKENLTKKAEVKRQLHLLKLISFLVPFLVGMKKKMRIPDINKMMPNLTADELRTERELPPLILGSDFACKNFNFSSNHYFHLHGGIAIDNETGEPTPPSQTVIDSFEEIQTCSTQFLSHCLDPRHQKQESFPIPVMEFEGKRYFAFAMDFETYYGQSPQKPKWVHAMYEEMTKLRPKRLPIADLQLHEHFKKFFGYKKTIKCKNLQYGLRATAQRGLVAMFQTQCRKCPVSRLGKQDEAGLSLVHYAAMFNRPQIITFLILQSMDINVKRVSVVLASGGPTPLHLAARCGSLDATSCLVANYANILALDEDGWAPIHHAAYFDHEPIIRHLIRRNDAQLELQTKNEICSTPLLLAASAGALTALRCLIDLGAYLLRTDEEGNNLIHLAAMRFHTNILRFFIEWDHPQVPVWTLLVDMLRHNRLSKKDAAVKCLEVMSDAENFPWQAVLDAGGVAALLDLLRVDNEEIQSVALAVLCNISENEPVRRALSDAKAGPILVHLLTSANDDIQSRSAIVLSDLACVGHNQDAISEEGGVPAIINLLDSEVEDVLVNAVNVVRVMCKGNMANQTAFAQQGAIEPLVEFLLLDPEVLKAAASAAIGTLAAGHRDNQNAVMAEGAAEAIVRLVRGHNIQVEVKAASALEALAENNSESQKIFLDLDAPKALMKLLKVWSLEVKEQGACSLWALAGHTKRQQKYIAERIEIPQLIDMQLLASEKLQYVGCKGMTALGLEDMDSQNRIAEQAGIPPLIRLLRSHKTTEKVLLTVIKTIGTLCIGVAHKNNRVTQRKIAEERAIPTLVQLMVAPPSEEIQVEAAYALGCVVLGHRDNHEKLKEETAFNFDLLLDLLVHPDESIRIKAGFALAIFAFNNTPQQYAIREAGGIKYSCFKEFLDSNDDNQQCNAAFQVVVLSRVIVDADQVSLTARGVTTLVRVLNSDSESSVIMAASLMSSLAHTRAGITDAMIVMGAVESLMEHQYSHNEQIRFASAIALGYLTFNRTAGRTLLTACRNTPGLYDKLMENIGKHPKISQDFLEEFRRCRIVGLPCMSLEVNGGPDINSGNKQSKRPQTTHGMHPRPQTRDGVFRQSAKVKRAASAPAAARAQSAPGPRRMHDSAFKAGGDSRQKPPSSRKQKDAYSFLKTQLSAWDEGGKRS